MVMAIVISIMLLFSGIGFLVVIHICIVGRALRRGLAVNGHQDNKASTGISHDDLERIPSFSFKGRENGSSPVDCAVCLDNFRSGEKCRMLPLCKHSFHAECVDSWLLKNPLCPICRSRADSFERLEVGECNHEIEVELDARRRQEVEVQISDSISSPRLEVGECDHEIEVELDVRQRQEV